MEYIQNIWQIIKNYITSEDGSSLTTQIFIIVFITLLASFLAGRVLKRLRDKADLTVNIWDDAFICALRKPIQFLIWVFGIAYAVELANKGVNLPLFDAVEPVKDVCIIMAITAFVLHFIKFAEEALIEQKKVRGEKLNLTTLNAIVRLLKASVIITAILILMQTFGVSISGILAFGGVSGIAVGFAAKDLLANFFGAIMIYMDKPFEVGDFISSPDRNIEGTVELIGWRQTALRTLEKRPIYVPNSVFSTVIVENRTRMTHRRLNEVIGVRYDDVAKLPEIMAEIKQFIEKHDDTDEAETLVVNVEKFNDSSVDFFITCYTKVTGWAEFNIVKEEILLAAEKIIASHKAEIAFPTSTIHIAK